MEEERKGSQRGRGEDDKIRISRRTGGRKWSWCRGENNRMSEGGEGEEGRGCGY